MRAPRETDFFIPIDGVGTFRYGRRTLGDRMRIRAQYLRYTEEFGDDDPNLSMYAGMFSTHSVLCVEAPSGWEDLADIDATDEDKVEAAFKLFTELKKMEDSFDKGVVKSGEGQSEGDA